MRISGDHRIGEKDLKVSGIGKENVWLWTAPAWFTLITIGDLGAETIQLDKYLMKVESELKSTQLHKLAFFWNNAGFKKVPAKFLDHWDIYLVMHKGRCALINLTCLQCASECVRNNYVIC